MARCPSVPEDGSKTQPVYLVGQLFRHHSRHSGYAGFERYVGTRLQPPVQSRRFPFRRFNDAVSLVTGRPYYSLGALLTEVSAGIHLLTKGDGLYHMLYGDMDYWLLSRIPRRSGTAVLATFHEPPEVLESLRLSERLLRSLDAAILMSESQLSYFRDRMPHERVHVVPHGIDTGFFRPSETRSRAPLLITVGTHHRDFRTLAEALDILSRRVPGLEVVTIGARKRRNDELGRHQFVRNLSGVSENELLSYYRRARVAVFCFQEATASNALLEAMACGTPIVATEVGGVREYLGDNAGILCPPEDPSAIAEAAITLLSNDQLAARLSTAARVRSLRYDYGVVAEHHAQVYRKISEVRLD